MLASHTYKKQNKAKNKQTNKYNLSLINEKKKNPTKRRLCGYFAELIVAAKSDRDQEDQNYC